MIFLFMHIVTARSLFHIHIILGVYPGIFDVVSIFFISIINTRFFKKETIFCLSLNFLNVSLEIRLGFFLTCTSSFSLILNLIRFNTNVLFLMMETKEF